MPVRYDRGTLARPELVGPGWLMVAAYLTRTGIFIYRNDDGSIRRELREPSEVFAPDSLKSFSMVPVTNDHPPELLTPETTKQYQVGQASELIERDGDKVRGKLMITDAAAIKDIESGKVQISGGYVCDLDETPGEINGQKYDARQKNIRGNHIAIVQDGRAGKDVRIKMDSQSMSFEGLKGKEDMDQVEIVIAGKKYMVSKDLADEFLAEIAEEGTTEDAKADPEKPTKGDDPASVPAADPAAKTDAAIAKLKQERDKAIAQRDALLSGKTKEAQVKADAAEREKIKGEVRERLSLENTVAEITGQTVESASTDRQLRESVIKHFDESADLTGKSDDYVQARYDIAIESADSDALARVREDHETDTQATKGKREDSIEVIRADSEKRQLARGQSSKLNIGAHKS